MGGRRMGISMTRARTVLGVAAVAALLAVGCTSTDSSGPDTTTTVDGSSDASTTTNLGDPAGSPPANPFLADSVVAIPHFDSAQTDSLAVAGPTGPTETLTAAQLTYQHLGPAHFGITISPTYDNGKRVIWSNGGDRISKLDYDSLDVLAELPIPGKTPMAAAEADQSIATLDGLSGVALATQGVGYAAKYLAGVAGVYYLLDKDNTLFVGGSDSIIAYHDVDPRDPTSPIEVRSEFARPPEVGGSFTGANITFDGQIVMVTTEGWVVLVARDFSTYKALQLPGAEAAPAHNAERAAAGKRPGSADWVRNSVAVDAEGGIYVASVEHMNKVVWDGQALSNDPAKGAWSEPYLDSTKNGTGATPSLMGFGDDRFVVITDGQDLMNVVAFWRDDIPDGWAQLPGGPRAGASPASSRPPWATPTARPSRPSRPPWWVGSGPWSVNNDPASVPQGFPPAGVRALAGYSGADPAFTPHGMQKFEWDPSSRQFREAWAAPDISSANGVPVVSTGSNLVYTVGARDGQVGAGGDRLVDRHLGLPLDDRLHPLQHPVLGAQPRRGGPGGAHHHVRDRSLRRPGSDAFGTHLIHRNCRRRRAHRSLRRPIHATEGGRGSPRRLIRRTTRQRAD